MTPRLWNSLVFAWSVSAALWMLAFQRLEWRSFGVGWAVGFSLAVMIAGWAVRKD